MKKKKTEIKETISYKVITGRTILYQGLDRAEALKAYNLFVNQNIPVKHIYEINRSR